MPGAIASLYRRLFPRAETSTETLDAIAASPRFYPTELKLEDHPPAISFVEVGQDTYRRSSFLDHRMHREPKQKTLLCDARGLLDRYRGAPESHVGFIFHIAYCCSTLLARYLELLPGTFVLKEPFIPTQLAELNRVPWPSESGFDSKDATRLSVHLMARTFDPHDRVVAKLADQCNAIAGALMAASMPSPEARRAVFLGLELRSFLLAGLKTDQRRAWVRRRAELAAQDVAPSLLTDTDPKTLDDARACAYLWLAHGVLLQKLIAEVGPDRILVVDGESISDNPDHAVREIAEWLGLSPSDSGLRTAIGDQTAGRYSKDPSQEFSREHRQADLAAVYAKFGSEVESGLRWAGELAPRLGLDPASGTMLSLPLPHGHGSE
jgi:hypothetical protein